MNLAAAVETPEKRVGAAMTTDLLSLKIDDTLRLEIGRAHV